MNGTSRITDAEWQVMKVIWQEPGASAQAVIARLGSTKKWSPATIKTLLGRLVQKEVLRFEKSGKAYLYFPLHSEEECQKVEATSFLQRVFGGALSPMIAHLIRDKKLTDKELAELESLIRQKKGKS